MKAVAVAGGEGTRIRPLTLQRPKPLVPLVNQPILAHLVRQMRRFGLTELRLTLRYMASLIQNHFQSIDPEGLAVRYFIEDEPLGTAGSLRAAVKDWDEPFLVVSGDGLTDLDFRQLFEVHRNSGAEVTIALHREQGIHDYGVVLQDENRWVYDFVEKPRPNEQQSDTVNTGIYILNPSVLDLVPQNQAYDFSLDLFPALLRQGRRIYGHVMEGYWCDIGNTEQYMRATRDVLEKRVALLDPLGMEIAPGIWAGHNVSIHPKAKLRGPVYLGHDVQINAHAEILGPAVIRNSAIVDSHAHVEHSIIWRNSYVGPSSQMRGAIVGRQCSVKAHALVSEGCVLGDGCVLEEGAILMPRVRMWPHKRVKRGDTVRESIVWGQQERQELFQGYSIRGQTNLDLTSEIAAKIGVALGSILKKNDSVAINRDAHRASRMIKRAIVSGLPSAGVNVLDMGSVAMPVLRHFVRRNPQVQAGVHVRVNPDDPHPQSMIVQLLEEDGSNLGKNMERKIQATFSQESFRRVGMDDLGAIAYARNFMESYARDFLSKIFAEPLDTIPFKLVVDYSNGLAADVMSGIFEQLQIETVPLNSRVMEDTLFVDRSRLAKKHEELAAIVSAVNAHLGVMFDETGEIIHLVDDRGAILDPRQTDILFLDVALHRHPYSQVVYPDIMPQAYDEVVQRYEAVVSHSKSDMHNLMTMAASGNVLVALNGRGHFIFPFFHPAPDPMMAILKLLEYLAIRGETLSQIRTTLPDIHYVHGQVKVPWTQKSRIMSLLHTRFKDARMDTLNGLKIAAGAREWVHLQPSPVDPAIEITVDASSTAGAQALLEEHGRAIRDLVHAEERTD